MANLSGLGLLVTRPGVQGERLCELISAQGGAPFHFPTLAFVGPPDQAAFQQALLELGQYEWWIFTSPQAVYACATAIRKNWPFGFSSAIKWAAVGAGTAATLGKELGVKTVLCPSSDFTSEGLLALPDFQTMTGKKVAIIRGAGGREVLDRGFTARGASVLSLIAYERILPALPEKVISECLDLLTCGRFQGAISTSYEGTRNLKLLLTERGWPYLKQAPLIVCSERVKMLVQALGYENPWVVRNASPMSILMSLADRRFRDFAQRIKHDRSTSTTR